MQKPKVQATVVLLVDTNGRVCLARKKQAIHHDNGEDISYSLGMYNGYGGKREQLDGSIEHTAICELAAEARVLADVKDLELVSRVYFWKPSKQTGELMPFMEVFFFLLHSWKGEPQEGREMGPPEWFFKDDIPYGEMMPADEEILTQIFLGEHSVAEVKLHGQGEVVEFTVLDEPLAGFSLN